MGSSRWTQTSREPCLSRVITVVWALDAGRPDSLARAFYRSTAGGLICIPHPFFCFCAVGV